MRVERPKFYQNKLKINDPELNKTGAKLKKAITLQEGANNDGKLRF